MLFDTLNTFAEAEATGNTGTNSVGDVIDLEATPDRDMGAGMPVYLNVLVDTAIAAGGSTGTYQVKLVTSDNSNLSSGTDLVASAEFDSSSGVSAGTVLMSVAIPSATYARYLGIQEVVANENTTAGKITAFLSKDQRAYTGYPDAL